MSQGFFFFVSGGFPLNPSSHIPLLRPQLEALCLGAIANQGGSSGRTNHPPLCLAGITQQLLTGTPWSVAPLLVQAAAPKIEGR